MNHVCIDIDVWCNWDNNPPVYRVYVDQEMLAERTFTLEPVRHYIQEHIEVFLDSGWHDVRVENCTGPTVKFVTNNVKVNGQATGTTFLV